MTDQPFRVDLRGLVDLLSQHLYSGPRVYVRELLQNAVDAVRARADLAPPGERTAAGTTGKPAAGTVRLIPYDVSTDGRLHCVDTGAGLTRDEVERFLATIGSSSKRDELGFARNQYLGQFGIGLLSCFLVSDEIELVTRSARGGPAVRWVGNSAGGYTVEELPETDVAVPIGTTVRLRPRAGMAEWLAHPTVLALAEEFGAMLAVPIEVVGPDDTKRVNGAPRPWDRPPTDPAARRELSDTAEALLGVPVLTVIPVAVPAAGLRGLVAVLGVATAAAGVQAHRVYAKGMLVGTNVPGLLPDWAFFARLVIDTDQLRLTASREALYDDDLLEQTRHELGQHIRRWLLRTAAVDRATFGRFLDLHALAVKAMAGHDAELLRAALPWLRFETSAGVMTVPDVAARFGRVRYSVTVDEYRQLAPVAAAQGLGVLNAGYAYDVELLVQAGRLDPTLIVEPIAPGDLTAYVAELDETQATVMRPFLTAARQILAAVEIDVDLRAFEPATLPGLVLDDRENRHRRGGRAAAAESDDVWAQVLRGLDDGAADRPLLLLNHLNPTVRRVARLTDPGLLALGVESLYCHALLLGRHPLRPADTVLLDRSFVGLLDRAVGEADTSSGRRGRPHD